MSKELFTSQKKVQDDIWFRNLEATNLPHKCPWRPYGPQLGGNEI